jgi:site-specific recombinase XerD
LTDSKRLKDSTRDDGRKLVTYFEGQGLKSASIKKKIGWLTSAVNLAISEGRLAFNPFSSIIPRKKDAEKRLPLDDADIEIIKARLDGLSDSDQVLLRLLGCTGMRLSEAFEIAGEKIEQDVRYIIIGSKTPQSLRRVPLPGSLATRPSW